MIKLLFKSNETERNYAFEKAKENTISLYKNLYRDIVLLKFFVEKLENLKISNNITLFHINNFAFDATYIKRNKFIRDKEFYLNLRKYIKNLSIIESMDGIKKNDKLDEVLKKCQNVIIEKDYYYMKSLLEIKNKEMEFHKLSINELKKILSLNKIKKNYKNLEEKLTERI